MRTIQVATSAALATRLEALTMYETPGTQWTVVRRNGRIGLERTTAAGIVRLELSEQFKEEK